MKKIGILASVFLLTTVSCSESNINEEIDSENIVTSIDSDSLHNNSDLPDGFQLLESTCFACHNPNPLTENKVAPTIGEIKKAYIQAFNKEDNFIDGIQTFLANPSHETALMQEAITTFGLMPQMSLQNEQSIAIAKYLYQNRVEADDWFAVEYPKEQKRVLEKGGNKSYIDRGFEYAMATKSVLGKNLKGKINSEGTLAAVTFCNINAVHFADSMSAVYDAEIRRVSDKPRNANNQANIQELSVIYDFKKQLEDGSEIVPVTVEEEDHVFGYYPIVTNDMCLKCHGDVAEIEPETYAKIELLYPSDKATGYQTNQLRGIWVVKMNR